MQQYTEQLIERVTQAASEGHNVRVDLKKRTIRVDRKTILTADLPFQPTPMPREACLSELEGLYGIYKHSVPSERTNARRTPFKALPEGMLSDHDLLYGQPRAEALARLETTLLLRILDGSLTWDESMGSWFWQSPQNHDFVILRDWVQPDKQSA